MKLRAILDRIDALKAEIDALRPIDPEQEARVRQMLRIDWNYHSNAIEGNTLTLREHLASYDA
jgi:Fic family protein